jgi:ABC-type lipoprotein export system ATPase subunit
MPLLSVSNLHKTYKLGRVSVPVLRGVDLEVNEGEFVAVLGSSGSGKSTMLHLIGGLDRPDARPAGSILFSGASVSAMSAGQLDDYRKRDVGFVFQFYHLLPELSVLQNVIVGAMIAQGPAFAANSGKAQSTARELLQGVGLSHRLDHRPAELSGGERQRVAIARSLINSPRLLLADEPTGNLDHETGEKVLDMLLDLRKSRAQTMIVVTHDPQTAARADRIVRLADGRVTTG